MGSLIPRVERATNNEDREALFGESAVEAEKAAADGVVNTVFEFKALAAAEQRIRKNAQVHARTVDNLEKGRGFSRQGGR